MIKMKYLGKLMVKQIELNYKLDCTKKTIKLN